MQEKIICKLSIDLYLLKRKMLVKETYFLENLLLLLIELPKHTKIVHTFVWICLNMLEYIFCYCKEVF